MTVIEYATNGLRSDLERVGADVDESLFADLDTMTTGYGSDDEREALLESARWVHLTLEPMLDANESTWVEADSRQAYEHVLHRHGAADAVRLTRGRSFEALSAIETLSSRSEWMFFHEPFYAGHDHGLAITRTVRTGSSLASNTVPSSTVTIEEIHGTKHYGLILKYHGPSPSNLESASCTECGANIWTTERSQQAKELPGPTYLNTSPRA